MDQFVPPIGPSPGSGSENPKPNVLRGTFGDGYSQRAIDGINNSNHVYAITWSLLTPEQANEIEAFLYAHVAEPFQYFVPLLNAFYVYTVLSWDRKAADEVGNETISAQFQQERDPA